MKEILTITSDDDIIIVNVKNNLMFTIIKAAPHKDCAEDAPTDFSSDCIEISQAYLRMSRDFCAR